MAKIINSGNYEEPDFNVCKPKAPLKSIKDDITNKNCGDKEPSLNDIAGPVQSWFETKCNEKTGYGASAICDPLNTGKIVNDVGSDRDVIYRYPNSIRGIDEAMLQMFSDITVFDEMGKIHKVPLVPGTGENAIRFMAENVRKGASEVVDRIRLPIMALQQTGFNGDPERYAYSAAIDYLNYLRKDGKPGFTINENGKPRGTIFGVTKGLPIDVSYTLHIWTLYKEDLHQIVQQVYPRIFPQGYIRVHGVQWESIVKYESYGDNIDYEPGDKKDRIVKGVFNMTAKSYFAGPIVRKKAVLETKIDMFNGIKIDESVEALSRLVQSIKDLDAGNSE